MSGTLAPFKHTLSIYIYIDGPSIEFADITDNVLKGLGQLVNDEKIRPFFRSLSVRKNSFHFFFVQPRTKLGGVLIQILLSIYRSRTNLETDPTVHYLVKNARNMSFST